MNVTIEFPENLKKKIWPCLDFNLTILLISKFNQDLKIN